VRHSVRTAVIRNPEPAHILEQTNAALLDQVGPSEFCTVALAQIDLEPTGSVKVIASSAGHPCPIVLRADGRAETIGCHGTLLGVIERPDLVEVTVPLNPGDAVILYTDGFTEARRGDELFGEQRMLETAATLAGRDADGIADGFIQAVN